MTNAPLPNEPAPVNPLRRATLWVGHAVAWLLNAYVLLLEMILGLGFVLLLFGANPSNSFVEWAYRNLDKAMKPFRGIFAPIELGTAGNDVEAVVDTSVLFAMLVYGIVLVVLQNLLQWLDSRARRLDRQDEEYERYELQQQTQASMQQQADIYASQPLTVPDQAPGATPPPGPTA
jgi:hypothetical protein